jgi:tripartite-type tricarboxylate transporter receptor subunit TctC
MPAVRLSRLRSAALFAGPALLLASLAHGAAAEDFYKGKQINVIVGSAAGGGYDAYSRLVARHLGDHIAGDPNIIVQNMDGASGVRAANYVYNVAPRDGTVIATVQRATLIEPVFGNDKIKIDARKLSWLGSLTTEWSAAIVGGNSGLTSLEDAQKREFSVSASGATSDAYIYSNVLNNLIGTKFKIVNGYQGSQEQTLAMQRGEIAGRIGWAWGAVKSTASDQLARDDIKPIAWLATEKKYGLDLPLARDYAQTEEARQILDFVFSPQEIGRPYFGPPEVPAAQLALLRQGFVDMAADPAFLAEADKLKLDIDFVDAQGIASLIDRLYATPPDIIAKSLAARDSKEAASKASSGKSPAAGQSAALNK